jgi:molecular chaperone DnaK
MLRDNADKLSESDKSRIQEAITAVKDALKEDDAAAIKSASDRLNEASQAISAELYRAASDKAQQPGRAEGGQTSPGGGASKDDDVIDAEVVSEQNKRGH